MNFKSLHPRRWSKIACDNTSDDVTMCLSKAEKPVHPVLVVNKHLRSSLKLAKCCRAHQPHHRRPRVQPLGDHVTRKDDKGDQQSGGETTWTNTGGTVLAQNIKDRLTWRRHAEAFAQPRDTSHTMPCPMMMTIDDMKLSFSS